MQTLTLRTSSEAQVSNSREVFQENENLKEDAKKDDEGTGSGSASKAG